MEKKNLPNNSITLPLDFSPTFNIYNNFFNIPSTLTNAYITLKSIYAIHSV